ncbi:glycosyltransferase family 4 protein [Candidatus Protofrankia californiensis]|uniref:glycosyltransferase family 4 protein n=1 Tax=Candidatus Protofrankia californiensis TaxID=1839754 RepID=UPI00104120D7|nr:glycosyltransferase family 4 protein [Candidatus Protofrankia californiensis]
MTIENTTSKKTATGKRPLRVLYSFPHTLGRPGISTAAFHQVRSMIDAGFAVTVYCTSLAADLDGAAGVVETMVTRGRRIPHRAIGVRRAYGYHDRRTARELATRPYAYDVVHGWPRGCIHTLRTAHRIGVPGLREVCSPHSRSACGLAEQEAAACGIQLPRGHAHRGTTGHLQREDAEYDAASALLCPSDYVVQTFVEHGVAADRLVRHAYGYDPTRFFPTDLPRSPGRPFTMVFAGRGEPNKGLHYALRAWRDAGTPGELLICGVIMPEYRASLGELLRLPGVRELGFVDDLGALFRSADALVLPSVTEGSALVTLEAAACGCVPVISDACGAPTRHLVDGLVHRATNTAELVEHIKLLAEDPAMLTKLRQACLDVRGQHTWDAAGVRLAEVYRTVARPRPPGLGATVAN